MSKKKNTSLLKALKSFSKHVTQATTKMVNSRVELFFPITLPEDTLFPRVSVITVTKNRGSAFDLPCFCWNTFQYPEDKIEWIIVDDSDSNGHDILKQKIASRCPRDKRIKLFHREPFQNIAIKRNFAVCQASGKIIVNMDDDDFHFKDSILAKVKTLLTYKKDCLFSLPIGVYNVKRKTSQVLDSYAMPNIPEATMAFTKAFWSSSKDGFKFSNAWAGEGFALAKTRRRQNKCINIPFYFSCICLTHSTNITGKMRDIDLPNNQDCRNFTDLLPPRAQYLVINYMAP